MEGTHHVFSSSVVDASASASRDKVACVGDGSNMHTTTPTTPAIGATSTGAAVVAFFSILGQGCVDNADDAGWSAMTMAMARRRSYISPLVRGSERAMDCSRGKGRGADMVVGCVACPCPRAVSRVSPNDPGI